MFDATTVNEKFNELLPEYKNLSSNLKSIIEDKLVEEKFGFFRVENRIKSWESFHEKAIFKKYKDPIDQIHDICGFRIVALGAGELTKILNIIKNEFDIIETVEEREIKPDQFNYRSLHFVAKIKKEWLQAPQFKKAERLKIEIQIRSELMDAWANISHQIFYKKESLPASTERRLFRLSALLEICDSEITDLIEAQKRNNVHKKSVNVLQDMLDTYLPNRKKTPGEPLLALMAEMEEYKFSLSTLENYFVNKLTALEIIENQAFAHKNTDGVEVRWWQIGVVKGFMFLTIDEYWNTKNKEFDTIFVSTIENNRKDFLN